MTEVDEHQKSKIRAVEDAIQLALASRWEEAVRANQELLDRFGPDEDTCNRHGKALLELGRLEEARAAYRATEELNPLNQIAKRQLAKIGELLAGKGEMPPVSTSLDIKFFTEEPGKTTLTRVVADGDLATATVAPGDPVEIAVDPTQVMVRTVRGATIGSLEPRVAQRLRRLVDAGNRYAGAVTHIDGPSVQVILREVHQAPEMAGTTSFPIRKGREMEYRPYAKETLLVRDEDPVVIDEDDAELATQRPARPSEEMEEGFGDFDDLEDAVDTSDLDEDEDDEDQY